MDQTHRTMVHRRKHSTMVYIKYGHVSSYFSELAVGTGRAALLVARGVSCPLSVVAMTLPLISALENHDSHT